MPTSEINAQLRYRNTSGDTTVMYPMVKADNIVGNLPITAGGTGASTAAAARAMLGITPAFTYGTDDISAGSTSDQPDGTIHFVYATTTDGVWDCVKKLYITVDGVWRFICNMYNGDSSGDSGGDSGTTQTYSIDTSSCVNVIVSGDSEISSDGTATLTFTAETGYSLSSSVGVTGASYTWNRSTDASTGELTLTNPTDNVSVIVIGIAESTSTDSYYIFTNKLTNVTAGTNNPTTIAKGGTAELTFTAESGYILSSSVDVTGASYTWDQSTGKLILSEPEDSVIITITAIQSYSIDTSGCVGVTLTDPIPQLVYGGSATLSFSSDAHYYLPDSSSGIVVTGAVLDRWAPDAPRVTGTLEVSNIVGDIKVTMSGVRCYQVKTEGLSNISYLSYSGFLTLGNSVVITLSVGSYYMFPDVSALNVISGATFESWTVSFSHAHIGELVVKDITGDIYLSIAGIPAYSIFTALENVTADANNPTRIAVGGTAELTFTANTGYTLPSTVSVSGATHGWDQSTGKLTLSNPEDTVMINVFGVTYTEPVTYSIATNLTGVTGADSNPTKITVDGTAQLTFIANEGYTLPSSVSVTGATISGWSVSDGVGTLTLSNPTGDVTVTVEAEAETATYTITYILTGVTGESSNPTTTYGEPLSMAFTANDGFHIHEANIIVDGEADWQCGSSSDLTSFGIQLWGATSDITITVTGVSSYPITYNLTGVTADSANPTTVAVGKGAELYFTANTGYALPSSASSISVTNAILEGWEPDTGALSIDEPYGDVTITMSGEPTS